MMGEEGELVDWEDLSVEDQQKAQELLKELNLIMDKYTKGETECENIASTD